MMAEMKGKSRAEVEKQTVVFDVDSEEWCFVCKDGGDLMLCDYKNCPKAYHPRCVGEKKSFMYSEKHWDCVRHLCCKCGDSSKFSCYTCPKSVCNSCKDPKFVLIKGRYGLCRKCIKLALVVEDVMMRECKGEKFGVNVIGKKVLYFKEYYEFVKKREGFDLDNFISEKRLEMKTIYECSPNSDDAVFDQHRINDNDKSRVVRNGIFEAKRGEGSPKREYTHVEAFDKDLEMWSRSETRFAAIIPENIRLVYLTKSLVMELLKQPELFGSKVEGSFVRVKSDLFGDCKSNSYQLLQVVGITKDLSGRSPFKLQLLNMPSDIYIDSLSDDPFSEDECEALRQKVDVELLNRPTIEELEHKARGLHPDLITHMIAKEKKTLQMKIDRANEKGRKDRLVEYLKRRQRLESESEVMRLLNTPPMVIAEVPKVKPDVDRTTDDRKRKRSFRDLLPVSIDVDGIKGASDNDRGCVKQGEVKPKSYSNRDEVHGSKTSSGTLDNVMGCVKQGEFKPKSYSNLDEVYESKTSAGRNVSKSHTRIPDCPVIKNSLDDAALNEMLDELIRPSSSGHPVCVFSEGLEHMERGCILSLKTIPISNYKDAMIPIANGLFAALCSLNIDYTPLYGLVKDYIRCAARLANIENTKDGPSVEELTANHKSKMLQHEKSWEALKISTSACESNRQLGGGHNEVDWEFSGRRTESLSKMIENLKKSENEMRQASDALDKLRRKQFEEEQMEKDFMKAREALELFHPCKCDLVPFCPKKCRSQN